MNQADIPFLSATQLAQLIQSKEVSPVEATQAYLDRIEAMDGQLHAYITVCAEEALAQARQAEQEIAIGGYRGPMHGIPVAVKDQFYTQGIRTTNGSSIHQDFVPDPFGYSSIDTARPEMCADNRKFTNPIGPSPTKRRRRRWARASTISSRISSE